MVTVPRKPKLAVWKFSSCDGCQLSVLDLEDALLALAERIEIAYFPEATRACVRGPYDVSLVEGSVTTEDELQRIQQVRKASHCLIALGACATGGGIQSLRNFGDVREFIRIVYPSPKYIEALDTSTPIANHVRVDLELRGCPINKSQFAEVVSCILRGQKPSLPTYSVCVDCKLRGNVCVMVAQGIPCMGPVTQAGCGALCPSYERGCYGCFGPMESPNTASLSEVWKKLGTGEKDLVLAFRGFNASAEAFRKESEAHERQDHQG